MENDFYAQLEMRLDRMATKIKALEDAVMQIPAIRMEVDPSRPAGVTVEPAALTGL